MFTLHIYDLTLAWGDGSGHGGVTVDKGWF